MSGASPYLHKTLVVSVLEDERQHRNLLFAYGVQGVRVQAQDLENGRRHLLVQHWRLDLLSGPSLPRQQQSNMNIIFIQAAVFGDLGAAGEDDAGVGLENDVRGALIEQRTVELVAQRGAGKDFLNTQRILVGGKAEIGNHARSQRRVGQPDQGTVVRNVERLRRANQRGRLAAADADALLDINRRLSML